MAPSPAAANIGFHLAMDTLPSGNCKRWLQVRLGCVQLSPSCPFRLLHTCLSPGPRGITPAFGYGAPHPSARGTSTLLINALLSAQYVGSDGKVIQFRVRKLVSDAHRESTLQHGDVHCLQWVWSCSASF